MKNRKGNEADIQGRAFTDWWEMNCCNYDAILFDIDGTLMHGKHAMPGALEMVNWLHRHHFPCFLLTNDGNHSAQEKSQFLQNAGLPIKADEIVSCSMALTYLAEHRQLKGKLFFVMGDLGNPHYAETAGLRVCQDLDRLEACYGIIVGEGVYDWQRTITGVINVLRLFPEKLLIVPNPDSYWPTGKKGNIGLGAGSKARFICMILSEMGIEVTPIYLGKPYPLVYQYALDMLNERFTLNKAIRNNRILMLGDSLKSDILGANRLGMTSALVLTGITGDEHIKKSGEMESPDFIFRTLIWTEKCPIRER